MYTLKSIGFMWYEIRQSNIRQMVERPLREREVVGSNPGRAIPKALKWYQWLPCLTLSIIRQALALLSLTTNTTNIAQKLTKTKINPEHLVPWNPSDVPFGD